MQIYDLWSFLNYPIEWAWKAAPFLQCRKSMSELAVIDSNSANSTPLFALVAPLIHW